MHEVKSYNSMLTPQVEWTPAFIFGVYSYASDMMLKFAPSLADSYLSSALLEQLVQDLQREPKPVLKFRSFEEVNPLKFKMGPTVLAQIAYQALSKSLQTFSEFKYLTSQKILKF